MAKKRIKSELSIVFGKEPNFDCKVTADDYNSLLTSALHWYGQFGGAVDANTLRNFHKTWLQEWAKENGIKRNSFSIPTQGISTLGALARIALKGFPLSDNHVLKLFSAFENWPKVSQKKMDMKAHAKLLKIKARNKHEEAVKPALTVFDTAIDEIFNGAKKWSVNFTGSLNATQVKELTSMYKSQLNELELLKRGDKEISAAYAIPKLVINRMIKAYNEILDEVKSAANRGQVVRKAAAGRKKNVKPASSIVSKLKFLPVYGDYNLASVDPEKLVGAQVAWVFDTKKRLLKKYEAGASGIKVSGTTLNNCKGVQKKIRKPEDTVAQFANLPRTKADKEFDSINALEKECTGRMNADTIILKVF